MQDTDEGPTPIKGKGESRRGQAQEPMDASSQGLSHPGRELGNERGLARPLNPSLSHWMQAALGSV